MKLGVVGKGGTGKTTLSTLVALAYVGRGKRAVAVESPEARRAALRAEKERIDRRLAELTAVR